MGSPYIKNDLRAIALLSNDEEGLSVAMVDKHGWFFICSCILKHRYWEHQAERIASNNIEEQYLIDLFNEYVPHDALLDCVKEHDEDENYRIEMGEFFVELESYWDSSDLEELFEVIDTEKTVHFLMDRSKIKHKKAIPFPDVKRESIDAWLKDIPQEILYKNPNWEER